MRARVGRSPDQYYAFTARLAAAGHQRTAMRVVAVCILSLALPAGLAAAFRRTTELPGGQAALALIGIGCIGLASPWLKRRWPSRTESTAVVVLGAGALSAGSLIPADPMAGLLVAVAFVFILGFAALFHGRPLLVSVVVLTAATILTLAVRVALRDDLATSVAVTTPLVLLCVVVVYACRTIADVGGSPYAQQEIDPVTGLLARASFYEQVATLLGARHRGDDRYLVLVVAGIDGMSAIAGLHGTRGAYQAQVDAAQAIRETARSTGIISHPGEATFLIADTFIVPDPTPLVDRVLGSIAGTPTGMTASIGVLCTPLRPLAERPPYEVLDEVIALATEAMSQARAAGGNQARYVLIPRLSGDVVADGADD